MCQCLFCDHFTEIPDQISHHAMVKDMEPDVVLGWVEGETYVKNRLTLKSTKLDITKESKWNWSCEYHIRISTAFLCK